MFSFCFIFTLAICSEFIFMSNTRTYTTIGVFNCLFILSTNQMPNNTNGEKKTDILAHRIGFLYLFLYLYNNNNVHIILKCMPYNSTNWTPIVWWACYFSLFRFVGLASVDDIKPNWCWIEIEWFYMWNKWWYCFVCFCFVCH